MQINGKVAVITGAASGIGRALAQELAQRGAKAIALVDRTDVATEIANSINERAGKSVVAVPFVGDVTNEEFRKKVFDDMTANHGLPTICVPAAGITRDKLAIRLDKTTGKATIYSKEEFQLVLDVNLTAPIYWALEMIARIAEDRFARGLKRWDPSEGVQGAIVLIGSISSQGNRGQISYSATKAGLEGAAATLMMEAMFYGVRSSVLHPGFTDTPMVRSMGNEYIEKHVLPYTLLKRLIRPEEIADALCFLISNSAVSGELWADAGWSPSA
ncbi:MAG: SDR family oxidoreductase [Rhodocyclaceae bacterium]|nr:SDR family oxidoreductase [Rhodocyclaceae bacterium]MBX3667125.1 SDR family oxidoreductase [Rhodocyclaceae bacterium]